MSSRFEREVSDGRMVQVSAPAKVILHGEHSVVYGKTALACSLDIRTMTQIRSGNNKRQVKIEFPDIGSSHVINISKLKPVFDQIKHLESVFCSSQVGSISRLIQDVFPESSLDTELLVFLYLYTCLSASSDDSEHLSAVEVTVRSDIPIGAGLGSSAAFSVSLAGAIFHFLRLKSRSSGAQNGHSNGQCPNFYQVNGSNGAANGSNKYHLNEDKDEQQEEDHESIICGWAYNAEKIIHGNPSGLDNSICTYGGLLSYRKHPATLVDVANNLTSVKTGATENFMESIAVPRNLRILLINTKVARNTKALVAKVGEERFNLLPKVTAHILEAMDRVSQECKDTFAAIVNNSNSMNNNSNVKTTTRENGCTNAVEDQEKHKALFHKLEQLIDVNQGLLSALGVSHPCLDQIAAICLCKGQLHAKLTGAGGGGFAFALITPFHTEEQVSLVKEELGSRGFECWDTNIAGEGIKLHPS